jgi:hypothetical protein
VLGRFLFRWRGVIGFVAFGVVFWLARPTFGSCWLGSPLLLAGLALRFWASGYIGIEGRVREIGASRRIVSGPYRVLRHPLYIGNFLLVVGMLVALRPVVWLSVAVLAGFIVEYTLIVMAEEECLSGFGGNAECKLQNANCKMADGEERKAHCPTGAAAANGDSFSPARALVEWRTWVVTGVGFGLAFLKAFITR